MSRMEQATFTVRGDYSDDMIEEAKCQTVAAHLSLMHRGTGWIWDDRVIAKDTCTLHPDDERTHYELFGDRIYQLRFRGWFNGKLLTVSDRLHDIDEVGNLPERLLRHLMRKFNLPMSSIRIV